MNEIEENIWNYIDGTCTAEEHEAIGILIGTDAAYKQKYSEFLLLNSELNNIQLDEPSMAFNYNVMQAINAEAELKPLRSAINKRIIWVISAFFILSITALLVFVIANINWYQSGHPQAIIPPIQLPSLRQYFDGNVLRGFLMFDMVLGLYLLDTYLRKKLNKNER